MHMRLAMVLIRPGEKKKAHTKANEEKAHQRAYEDWANDIRRFHETSHINEWVNAIRKRFIQASEKAAYIHGFTEIFEKYDDNGSSELDVDEFLNCVRKSFGMDETVLTDAEVHRLFKAVDTDKSGELSAPEFVEWLFAKPKRAAVTIYAHIHAANFALKQC